jgi:hypothetical protein
MTKPKKPIFHRWNVVALLASRQVLKVGYETDIDTILDDMLDEADWPRTLRPTRKESRSSVDRTGDACLIWRKHPAFKEVAEKLKVLEPEVERSWLNLAGIPGEPDDAPAVWFQSPGMTLMQEKLVMEAARHRLKSKMKHGAERKLFFGSLDECWVGERLCVHGKKTVRVGTYVAGDDRWSSHSDDFDCDLPGLKYGGTHVLLEVYRDGMYNSNYTRWVLASDCILWKQREAMEKVAETLMEDT